MELPNWLSQITDAEGKVIIDLITDESEEGEIDINPRLQDKF